MYRIKIAKIQRKDYIKNGYGDEEKWQEERRECLKRCNYTCQAPNCNVTRLVEVHHKIPVTKGGSKYSQSNLTCLCKKHHNKQHRHLR